VSKSHGAVPEVWHVQDESVRKLRIITAKDEGIPDYRNLAEIVLAALRNIYHCGSSLYGNFVKR